MLLDMHIISTIILCLKGLAVADLEGFRQKPLSEFQYLKILFCVTQPIQEKTHYLKVIINITITHKTVPSAVYILCALYSHYSTALAFYSKVWLLTTRGCSAVCRGACQTFVRSREFY